MLLHQTELERPHGDTIVSANDTLAPVAMGNPGVWSNRGRIGGENSSPCPVPSSPNCVCILGNSQSHVMAPYRYRNMLEEAKAGLKQVFSEMSRTKLILLRRIPRSFRPSQPKRLLRRSRLLRGASFRKRMSTFITKSPVF